MAKSKDTKVVIFALEKNLDFSATKQKLEKTKVELIKATEIVVTDGNGGPEVVRDVLHDMGLSCKVLQTDWKSDPKYADTKRDSALLRRGNYIVIVSDGADKHHNDLYVDAVNASKRARKFTVAINKGEYLFCTKTQRQEKTLDQGKLK